jgi:hypothetical protein
VVPSLQRESQVALTIIFKVGNNAMIDKEPHLCFPRDFDTSFRPADFEILRLHAIGLAPSRSRW